MIRFSLAELVYVYAGVFVAAVFIAWWAQTIVRGNREKRALKNVVRCGFCAHQFRDTSDRPMPRCPSCGGLVERKLLSRL